MPYRRSLWPTAVPLRRCSGLAQDEGLLKTPSFRNVALTWPYMHDGRFKTLEQVVEHYSSGTKPSAALDPNIAKHPKKSGVNLDAAEKAALVAVLRTLTDASFVRVAAPGLHGRVSIRVSSNKVAID